MATPLPLNSASGYYKRAWRVAIDAAHAGWSSDFKRNTLAYLWASRTPAEEAACTALVVASAMTLPAIDISIMPARPVPAKKPAHPRREAAITADQVAIEVAAQLAIQVPLQVTAQVNVQLPDLVNAQVAARLVTQGISQATEQRPGPMATLPLGANTTKFSFWPQEGDTDAEIPNVLPVDGEDGSSEDIETQKRKMSKDLAQLGNIGTLFPGEDNDDLKWHPARHLGQGSFGHATLWIELDAEDNIIDRMAIKDTPELPSAIWLNPVSWRDNLPREIAILQRLHLQQHPNIHHFRDYRLNMRRKRYRTFTNYCDYGTLYEVLRYHADRHEWRVQTSRQALQDHEEAQVGDDVIPQDISAINVDQILLHDKGSDLNDTRSIADQNPPQPISMPEHIPESFIWHIFSQLVDVFLVFQQGNTALPEHKPWKEIMHNDLAISNIFVSPPVNVDGTYDFDAKGEDFQPGRHKNMNHNQVDRQQWPHIFVADFDTSFFSLQGDDNEYQDNPQDYLLGSNDIMTSGRYPPELFRYWYLRRQESLQNKGIGEMRPLEGLDVKMSSKTNVWAIGQVIFNLTQNVSLASHEGDAPYFDGTELSQIVPDPDTHIARLVDWPWVAGRERGYTKADIQKNMFTGNPPYEITLQYNKELKSLVKDCLHSEKDHRPDLGSLQIRIRDAIRRNVGGDART